MNRLILVTFLFSYMAFATISAEESGDSFLARDTELIKKCSASSKSIDQKFKCLLTGNGYSTKYHKNHDYCFIKDGKIIGSNPLKLKRIASVSKLFTTYFALHKFKLGKKFNTTALLSPDGSHLHLRGGLDPFFEEEKIFSMMLELYNIGYKNITKITFDEKFSFAYGSGGQYEDLSSKTFKNKMATKILSYLNKKEWTYKLKRGNYNNDFITNDYTGLIDLMNKMDFDLKVPADFRFSIKSVKYVPGTCSSCTGYDSFTHTSIKLQKYIKAMNIHSKNFLAQYLFDLSGGVNEFYKVLSNNVFSGKHLGDIKKIVKVGNGSGLPDKRNGRIDNEATCSAVVQVIKSLNSKIKSLKLKTQDLVAVPGVDYGTFRKRLRYDDISNTVLAKTGTVNQTSALGGSLYNEGSLVPFAILDHTGQASRARKVQDEFISVLKDDLGLSGSFTYVSETTFPLRAIEFFRTDALKVDETEPTPKPRVVPTVADSDSKPNSKW
jgi:hypothetical protein